MLKRKHIRAIDFTKENLNFCPHCSKKPDVGVSVEDNEIVLACSCSALSYKVSSWNDEFYKKVARSWNGSGLEAEWSPEALKLMEFETRPYMVLVYETLQMVFHCFTLEEAYVGLCNMSEWDEYKGKTFAVGKYENGKIRCISPEEIKRELNVDW